MGNDQLTDAIAPALQPGETVIASRPVVGGGKVDEPAFRTSLALLGPSAFQASVTGSVAGGGQVPERTNFVVITDRRILWCSRARMGGDVAVGGSDHLASVATVEIVPARIALAKLRVRFHDGAAVQFDLPSDHKADDFADDVRSRLTERPFAA